MSIRQSFVRIPAALCGLAISLIIACASSQKPQTTDEMLTTIAEKQVIYPDDLDAQTLSEWKSEDGTFHEIMERRCANFDGDTNVCMESISQRIEKIRLARAVCWEVRAHEEGLKRCTQWSDHYRKCVLQHATDYGMQCPSIETFLPVNDPN